MQTPNLTGPGAAYIRVSTDQQDTNRQFESVEGFEKRFGVSIPKSHRFIDEGYSRDESDKRKAFQRLLGLAEAGAIQWIVVDRLDRFGTEDKDELAHYRYVLRKAGCKLFDTSGKEWTSADMLTFIEAGLAAEQSQKEQKEKSYRNLSGKVEKARRGEYQGGPVRLGFDVACYSRESNKELWRVVFEGRDKRLKVWPDGSTQRFDGKGNFPPTSITEVLRVTPSLDTTKLDAAKTIFKRYASETITFFGLACYLNNLGIRNCMGGEFQSRHISEMLKDPIYRGHYSFNKWQRGRFHRYTGGRLTESERGGITNNPEDWVISDKPLFPPLIDKKTWEAVQAKLVSSPKKKQAPRNSRLYLAGLVVCGNCGRTMTGRGDRLEYFCGTYTHYQKTGKLDKCPCLRNAVFQTELEDYLDRWLEEADQKLELLDPALPNLTDPLHTEAGEQWAGLQSALRSINEYLNRYHPEVSRRLIEDFGGTTSFDFDAAITAYRRHFNPEGIAEEIAALEAEHSRLMEAWIDLPTPRAKEKARAKLTALEARIADKERQRENQADEAEKYLRAWEQTRRNILKARQALSRKGEAGNRQKAQALRAVIDRIECFFTATGKTNYGGKGIRGSELVLVAIHSISGETKEFQSMKFASYAQAYDGNFMRLLLGVYRTRTA